MTREVTGEDDTVILNFKPSHKSNCKICQQMSLREVLLIFKHLFNEPSQHMCHDSSARMHDICYSTVARHRPCTMYLLIDELRQFLHAPSSTFVTAISN